MARLTVALTLTLAAFSFGNSQTAPTKADRDHAQEMLRTIKSDLKQFYYDPQYHGMNLDERFKTAEEKLKQATSLAQLLGVVGQVLLDLDDSHMFFNPPGRTYKTEYGWRMKTIGDRCYVVAVKPGSDAEAKGLQEGDEVVSMDGMTPTRKNLWRIRYLYDRIRPRPGMRLTIIKPNGEERQLDIAATIQEGKKVVDLLDFGQGVDEDTLRGAAQNAHLYRQRTVELGDVFVWKMPRFSQTPGEVKDMIEKVTMGERLSLRLRRRCASLVTAPPPDVRLSLRLCRRMCVSRCGYAAGCEAGLRPAASF